VSADRRLTPATDRVAHVSLKGRVAASAWTEGRPARLEVPLAWLHAAPGGARDRQLLMGAALLEIDRQDGWVFVQTGCGYCGWLEAAALAPPLAPTHWLAVPASHLYPAPKVQAPAGAALSLGAQLTVVGQAGAFAELASGAFVPRAHLRALDDRPADPVSVAESLLGTPYLWAGNSHAGIDCSGLVQVAFHACGRACPADSDLQWQAFGPALAPGTPLRRGDLVFWRGHVALICDATRILHANGHTMSVAHEGREAALARIAAAGEGAFLGICRPA